MTSKLITVLNGLVGDKLAKIKSPSAIKMSFRIEGKDVGVSSLDQKRDPKSILVFVHGLMADERIWGDFGSTLEKRFYVLYVRYNTGLRISKNGKALSRLLDELQSYLKPEKIILLGHSMGGLVIRSACHYGQKEKYRWVKLVPKIFLIAVPNAGAALEKIGHMSSFLLRTVARWYLGHVGNLIEQRSDGIKDLRMGSMLDEDWKSKDPSKLDLKKHAAVPPLPGVRYHILIGTLSKDDQSLMAKYFGDGLVTQGSAVADTLLKVSTVKVFPKTGHNSILKNSLAHQYVLSELEK